MAVPPVAARVTDTAPLIPPVRVSRTVTVPPSVPDTVASATDTTPADAGVSLSTIVSVSLDGVPIVAPVALASPRTSVSSPSTRASSTIVRVIVLLVSPAAKLTVAGNPL